MESSLLIYALTDPRTDEVRYVGKSCSGMYRPTKHLQPKALAKDDTYKGRWLRELLAAGHRPGMHAIAVYEDRAALAEGERQWIAYGLASCWPLTNCTMGGDGLRDPSPETRAKMSASQTGKKHSAETIARRNASIAAAWVGRVRPNKGKKHSPEHCAKISAANTGRVMSPETCARISASKMGHEVSAEARAKISAGKLGKKCTDDHRAKLRAAWARRKASSG